MKISKSILILLFIVFSSCQSKPMNDIDFAAENHKLYFVRVNEKPNQSNNSNFVREHSNFYIEDIEVLNKIKNNFIGDESEMKNRFEADYELHIVDANNNQIFNGKLDLNNGLLYSSESYYDFNSEFTLLPEVSFKPMEKISVEINSLKNAKTLLKVIENNNGFVSSSLNFNNRMLLYNGMTVIKASKDYLETTEINEKVIQKVENDLKDLGKVFVAVSHCNGIDYCKFYVYSENLNSDAIPKDYEIVKPLSDTIDESIVVYNMSLEKLQNVMKENNFNMNMTTFE